MPALVFLSGLYMFSPTRCAYGGKYEAQCNATLMKDYYQPPYVSRHLVHFFYMFLPVATPHTTAPSGEPALHFVLLTTTPVSSPAAARLPEPGHHF